MVHKENQVSTMNFVNAVFMAMKIKINSFSGLFHDFLTKAGFIVQVLTNGSPSPRCREDRHEHHPDCRQTNYCPRGISSRQIPATIELFQLNQWTFYQIYRPYFKFTGRL